MAVVSEGISPVELEMMPGSDLLAFCAVSRSLRGSATRPMMRSLGSFPYKISRLKLPAPGHTLIFNVTTKIHGISPDP